METFGEYIKRLRLKKGFNQTELAAQVKLDSGGLSKVENGKKSLNEERLKLFANVLEISEEEIFQQYFSDQFARETAHYNISENVFQLAQKKTKYYKNKNLVQGKLAM